MKSQRIRNLIVSAVFGFSAPLAIAQNDLPAGSITMIVGWPAGGPADNVARLTAGKMSEALGRTIVIDNKAGAGETLALTQRQDPSLMAAPSCWRPLRLMA